MGAQIPDFVRPALWSFKIEDLDLDKDNQLIITDILNYGSEQACRWLLSTYSHEIIKNAIRASLLSAWDKKSISLWSNIFDAYPETKQRPFI